MIKLYTRRRNSIISSLYVIKIFDSLQLIEDYEESFKVYKAAQPDPDFAKKEAEEKLNTSNNVKKIVKFHKTASKTTVKSQGVKKLWRAPK